VYSQNTFVNSEVVVEVDVLVLVLVATVGAAVGAAVGAGVGAGVGTQTLHWFGHKSRTRAVSKSAICLLCVLNVSYPGSSWQYISGRHCESLQ